jgi:hypothetical protein
VVNRHGVVVKISSLSLKKIWKEERHLGFVWSLKSQVSNLNLSSLSS